MEHSGPWSDTARMWDGPERPERGGPCCMSETEVNGDSTEYLQMKRVLPWLVRRACRASTRDFCPASAVLFGPEQNIFSSPYTISIILSSSAS